MQVDLFDRTLLGRTKRQMEQITIRKYAIDKKHADLSGMRPYFRNEEQYVLYKNKILSDISRGRRYEHIGKAARDSLFDVESLGISANGQDFVMIADYSLCLDYVLHRLCGCQMDEIRRIDDYAKISRAILTYDFLEVSEIPFSRLALASDKVGSYLASLAYDCQDQILDVSDRTSWVIYKFYMDIFDILSIIKFYTTVVICNSFLSKFGRKGIIRSTTYSKVLATVSGKFDEVVTIHDTANSDIQDYKIVYRTYSPFEYLGEVITKNEFSREV